MVHSRWLADFFISGQASCGLPAGQERRLSMRTKLTASERREATRLRAERWRRAHGIMPRKPAERPWLAMGISRSTYYL